MILKELILDLHNLNININSIIINYNQIYYLIRVYFKKIKYKQSISF